MTVDRTPIIATIAGPFIVRYWRYGAQLDEAFDTLDEALGRAYAIEDYGNGSVYAICEGTNVLYDDAAFSEYYTKGGNPCP